MTPMATLSTTLFSSYGCLSSAKFPSLLYPISHSSPRTYSSRARIKLSNSQAFSVNCVNRLTKVPSQEDIQYFWQWVLEKGGISSSSISVKPELVPERLGLVAQRNISPGEVVLEVPKKLWISMDTVNASEIGKLCQGLRPWVAISLFILREKSNLGSPWSPYLNILPETLDSPMFWSEEELAELRGTQLLSTVSGYKDYVENEFLKVQKEIIVPNRHLFNFAVTQEDFLWAFGMLRSRAFPPLTGDNLALVPFADLVNHGFHITAEEPSWERRQSGLFSRQEALAVRSPVAFKSGEQVVMQYGMNKSNAQLALDYGIVENGITNGSREVFTLTLEIAESDPFFADKLDIAELNGMETIKYFDITGDQGVPEAILTFLRLLALGGTDAFLLEPVFRDSVWEHLSLPVSQDNEAAVCKVILDGCRSALDGYATTIEEDEDLLRGQRLDPRLEIAVVIRIGEKRVLQEIIQSFEGYMAGLDQLEYYQERRLKDLGLVGEQGDIIFWEPSK
eukprot:Gb_38065 [translate_table: standard]